MKGVSCLLAFIKTETATQIYVDVLASLCETVWAEAEFLHAARQYW
jgi:hypothetical protein